MNVEKGGVMRLMAVELSPGCLCPGRTSASNLRGKLPVRKGYFRSTGRNSPQRNPNAGGKTESTRCRCPSRKDLEWSVCTSAEQDVAVNNHVLRCLRGIYK